MSDNQNWQSALEDAEKGLENALRDVAQWKQTVRICRERVRAGAPWPGLDVANSILQKPT